LASEPSPGCVQQEGQTGGNAVAEKRADFGYNGLGQITEIVRYDDTSGGRGNVVYGTPRTTSASSATCGPVIRGL
jgi:hypothetical protein